MQTQMLKAAWNVAPKRGLFILGTVLAAVHVAVIFGAVALYHVIF